MGKPGKSIISIAYELTLSAAIIAGILHRAGIFSPLLQLHTLYSFTTISNGCVMAIMLFTTVKYRLHMKEINPRLARIRYVGVILILITGLVYHFILLPEKVAENPAYQVFTFGNIVAHYIAPIGVFVDWLLFDKKGMVTKREPLICVSVPVLYFIITSLYGYFGSAIPGKGTSYVYFFMDIGALGAIGVLKWVAVIFASILVLVYSVYALDCILANKLEVRTR